jgi:hypothetical protein
MLLIGLFTLVLPLPVLYGGVVGTPILLEPIGYEKLLLILAPTILGRASWHGGCFYES